MDINDRGILLHVAQTTIFGTHEILIGVPVENVRFRMLERPDFAEPDKAKKLRHIIWNNAVREVCERRMRFSGDELKVVEDDDKMNKIVTSGKFPNDVMWHGETISMPAENGFRWDNGFLEIDVFPIPYSLWVACGSDIYLFEYESTQFPKPLAGFGVSVIPETTDGFIILTIRGVDTPVYHGFIYSPGGGPKFRENIKEAAMYEVLEETGLKIGHDFDKDGMELLAFVYDQRYENGNERRITTQRPEIVARLPLKVDAHTFVEIEDENVRKKGKREADVWGILTVPLTVTKLKQFIIHFQNQMCPPTVGGLVWELYWLMAQVYPKGRATDEFVNFMKDDLKTKRPYFFVPPYN